jgi:hypothetical protein
VGLFVGSVVGLVVVREVGLRVGFLELGLAVGLEGRPVLGFGRSEGLLGFPVSLIPVGDLEGCLEEARQTSPTTGILSK